MTPPLIALEEHFFSSSVANDPEAQEKYFLQLKHLPGVLEKVTNLDTIRLKDMDVGHISIQVVSHAAGQISSQQCRDANDELARAIQKNPERLAGFAVLPVAESEECAKELERTVVEHGFKGALIDNHTADGTYFDGTEYDVMWQKAQDLVVPIYIHPTWATDSMKDILYTGNFSDGASASLSASSFGWHSDNALHILRLFAAGVFDKFPKLKVIIGHFGEMIPFMLGRIEVLSLRWGKRKRSFREVWDNNIWITTSGVWSLDPMATILRNTKIERILFSVDYPFASNEAGLEWVRALEKSGMVDGDALEKICSRNAEELLGLKVTKTFD
jgi:predicted TIM-barrel fold metal-dependent hydrolase